MGRCCAAFGCSNRQKKGSNLKFFQFPNRNKSLLKLWICEVKRKNWTPSKYSVLCSEHFTENCFYTRGQIGSRTRLRPDAVPTLFCFSRQPVSKPVKKLATCRQIPCQSTTNSNVSLDNKQNSTGDDNDEINSEHTDHTYFSSETPDKLKNKLDVEIERSEHFVTTLKRHKQQLQQQRKQKESLKIRNQVLQLLTNNSV